MNTLIILSYNGENFELDIPKDIDINLTYEAGDIRNILNRSFSGSKTITFNGTKNNNLAFKNIYDVQNNSEFNPRKKSFIKIYDNGSLIFSGYLKLDQININDGLISYETTSYSDVGNLFDDISDLKLSDLNFREYSHKYNRDSITGSWETYIYQNGNKVPFQLGNGYVYPNINWGVGNGVNLNYTVNAFKPTLYAKTIVDKIFQTAGYTYESDFLNSEYFRKLIVTHDGNNFIIPEYIVENSKLKTTGDFSPLINQYIDGTQIYQDENSNKELGLATFPNKLISGNYDNGNNFSVTTNEYTASTAGNYHVQAKMFLNTSVLMTTSLNIYGTIASGSTFPLGYKLHVNANDNDEGFNYYSQICIRRNGVEAQPAQLYLTTFETMADVKLSKNGESINDTNIEVAAKENVYLEEGDIVYVKSGSNFKDTQFYFGLGLLLPESKDYTVTTYQTNPSQFLVEMLAEPIAPGGIQDFVNFLSDDKCKDFILSLSKMFNLYFTIDINDPKHLIIETRNDFYNGNVIDWNYKLDYNSDINLVPLSDFENYKTKFTYKEDSDFYNDTYTKNSGNKIYGEYVYINNDNEFIKNNTTEEISLIFSPTPLTSPNTLYNYNEYINSEIYKLDSNDAVDYCKNSKMRILFYGGMVDRPTTYRISEGFYGQLSSFQTLNKYAYAGMLDNPINPIDSLEFGFPDFYFYDRKTVTNSNLFTKFWEKFLIDTYKKDNKMFIGYFYLTDIDISNLNFRNIIFLQNRYWIINKIIDYNPVSKGLTKVELIMIQNYGETKSNIDSYQQTIGLNSSSRRILNLEPNGVGIYDDNSSYSNNFIKGDINLIGRTSSSSFMFGNYNQLGASSVSVGILGSENGIAGGTQRSMFIGSGITNQTSLNGALVVGDTLTATTMMSNAVNTNALNLITNSEGEGGAIYINGVIQSQSTIPFSTTGLTTYSLSAFSQFQGTSIIEVFITGVNATSDKFYGGKLFGVFGYSESTSTISQIGKTDIYEKTNFNNANCDFYNDGYNIFLNFEGEGAETITWVAKFTQIIN